MAAFVVARKLALANGEQFPKISNYIGAAIDTVARRIASRGNFSGYTFIDEMIADATENCIMYLHNYNPDKSTNAFAYISKIIWQAFLRRIDKEKKHSYIKHKLMFNQAMYNDVGTMDTSDSIQISAMLESMSNDKSADVIQQFENRIKNKKIKKEERDNEKRKSATASSN